MRSPHPSRRIERIVFARESSPGLPGCCLWHNSCTLCTRGVSRMILSQRPHCEGVASIHANSRLQDEQLASMVGGSIEWFLGTRCQMIGRGICGGNNGNNVGVGRQQGSFPPIPMLVTTPCINPLARQVIFRRLFPARRPQALCAISIKRRGQSES
jgi:hypothetical protein